jgi:hypothetical protein
MEYERPSRAHKAGKKRELALDKTFSICHTSQSEEHFLCDAALQTRENKNQSQIYALLGNTYRCKNACII